VSVTTISPIGANAGVPSGRTATTGWATGRVIDWARPRAGPAAGTRTSARADPRLGARNGARVAGSTLFTSADMISPPR
jgi:hypothetical protein